jgi:hypothetical protein
MATRKKTNNQDIQAQESTIHKATLDEPERFKLGSIGYSGLKIFDGVVESEMVNDLKYPNSNDTYRKMLLHPAVNASVSLHKAMVGKAEFRFLPPKDANAEEMKQTKIIEEMFQDMESTLEDLVSEAMTMLDYGFCPIEKVFRRRTKDSGSLYDDGLIGIRKLSLRHQQSVDKFIFSEDGERILGVKQDISLISDPFSRYNAMKGKSTVVIPREKILLFTTGDNKSNPYGSSPLRNVYLPWKYLQAIEELEASGVAKDLQGLPVIGIPAQFMNEDATPGQKAFYEYAKNVVRNMQMNSQSGLVKPIMYDDQGKPMFTVDLLSTEGKKNYDTTKIKEYYRMMIFIGLQADILLMGNTDTGSFALGAIKNSLTGTAVEGYLKRIVEVLNQDLIRQIYELNKWNPARRCKIDYEGFSDTDLETFSKGVQRMASVGLVPKTLDVVNTVLRNLQVDELPPDTDIEELLTDNTSRASDGMSKGSGNGTSDNVAETDNSSLNADNSA